MKTVAVEGRLVIRRLKLDIATQNLTILASVVPDIIKGVQNPKIGHVTLTTPLSVTVCHRRLGNEMLILPTKFEVSTFNHYGDMKCVEKACSQGMTFKVI